MAADANSGFIALLSPPIKTNFLCAIRRVSTSKTKSDSHGNYFYKDSGTRELTLKCKL